MPPRPDPPAERPAASRTVAREQTPREVGTRPADRPLDAGTALRLVLAAQARVRPEQLDDEEPLDELFQGASSRRNQVLLDLAREFGLSGGEGVAQQPVGELVRGAARTGRALSLPWALPARHRRRRADPGARPLGRVARRCGGAPGERVGAGPGLPTTCSRCWRSRRGPGRRRAAARSAACRGRRDDARGRPRARRRGRRAGRRGARVLAPVHPAPAAGRPPAAAPPRRRGARGGGAGVRAAPGAPRDVDRGAPSAGPPSASAWPCSTKSSAPAARARSRPASTTAATSLRLGLGQRALGPRRRPPRRPARRARRATLRRSRRMAPSRCSRAPPSLAGRCEGALAEALRAVAGGRWRDPSPGLRPTVPSTAAAALTAPRAPTRPPA